MEKHEKNHNVNVTNKTVQLQPVLTTHNLMISVFIQHIVLYKGPPLVMSVLSFLY